MPYDFNLVNWYLFLLNSFTNKEIDYYYYKDKSLFFNTSYKFYSNISRYLDEPLIYLSVSGWPGEIYKNIIRFIISSKQYLFFIDLFNKGNKFSLNPFSKP